MYRKRCNASQSVQSNHFLHHHHMVEVSFSYSIYHRCMYGGISRNLLKSMLCCIDHESATWRCSLWCQNIWWNMYRRRKKGAAAKMTGEQTYMQTFSLVANFIWLQLCGVRTGKNGQFFSTFSWHSRIVSPSVRNLINVKIKVVAIRCGWNGKVQWLGKCVICMYAIDCWWCEEN